MKKHIGVIMYQTSKTKGQEIVAQEMVREFNRIGQKAYLITGPYDNDKRIIPNKKFFEKKERYFIENQNTDLPIIRVNGYRPTWPHRRIMFKDFVYMLRFLVRKYKLNVLITHSTLWGGPEDVAKFIMWNRISRKMGVESNHIIMAHMSHFQEPDPLRYSATERAYRLSWDRLIFPQIFMTAKLILCVSPLTRKAMIKFGASKNKCFIFPAGINDAIFDNFKNSTKSFLKKYKLPKNAKLISYLGTIEERKNPLAVVQVAKKLRKNENIFFVVAGGKGSQYAQVKGEIKGMKNIRLIEERLSEEEKIHLIKSSYLNILLSRSEALGIAQLEFMYNGVPVITSAVEGQKWIVRNKKDGLHVNGPNDIDGAANAVLYLVKNKDVWERMSKNARERASEFSRKKLIKDLNKKLDKLLRKRKK